MAIVKYRVVKSKRRTLCLTVTKKGEVLVRSPYSVSANAIAEFVKAHERWIRSKLEKLQHRRQLNLNDGAPLILFGEQFTIREGKPKIEHGFVYLPAEGRESAFLKLIKRMAQEEMNKTVQSIALRYGFSYRRIRISVARTRWGSCNKDGVLSFTCLLAFVEPDLAAYVAVHELCHTRYFNHSKKFWQEVEQILPDWRALRMRLRKEEDCLAYLQNS